MAKKRFIEELKINVSFKQSEKELYDFVKQQRSPSNFMKDAVDFFIKHLRFGGLILEEAEEKILAPHHEEPNEHRKDEVDLMNF